MTGTPISLWRVGTRLVVRVLGSITVLVGMYYLLPLDPRDNVSPVLLLLTALVVLGVLVFVQTWAIANSPVPRLRAVEALATSIPLLILIFSCTYFLMSRTDPSVFSQPLSRTGALYFSMTTLSTVGYGDITPVTDTARLVVVVQMMVDLIVLGIGLHVVLRAVDVGRQRQTPAPETAAPSATASGDMGRPPTS